MSFQTTTVSHHDISVGIMPKTSPKTMLNDALICIGREGCSGAPALLLGDGTTFDMRAGATRIQMKAFLLPNILITLLLSNLNACNHEHLNPDGRSESFY